MTPASSCKASNGILLSHVVEVTTADVNDRNGALPMFLLHPDSLSEVTCILADGVYNDTHFADLMRKVLGAKLEVVKRNELHKFAVITRWVLECSFAR